GAEQGGALERARRLGVPSSLLGPDRRLLQRLRRFLVVLRRSSGQVPCAPIDVLVAGGSLRERPVRPSAGDTRRRLVDRRPEQRMTELESTSLDGDEAGSLGLFERSRLQPEAGQRLEDRVEVARLARGSHEESRSEERRVGKEWRSRGGR